MFPLGVLCQSFSRNLKCDFDVFPFIDSLANFTVNNTSVTQSSGKAVFNGTSPQYLMFSGTESFNLQESIDIEIFLTNTLISSPLTHTIFELKGATSYLVAQIYTFSTYAVFLTGATGGNADNYSIVGGLTLPTSQIKTLRVIYNPAAGTLKTYVDGVLDINQSGITPRINESRTMYLSSISYPELHANVDYFNVSIG